MAVNWKDLKREIHDEVEKVWLKEPLEVTMSKLGVFPSGAGTDNQILGNLFFLNADTQAMGWWTIEPSMYCVLGDDKFSLDAVHGDRKSTRLNSSHVRTSRMPSSA